MAQTKEGYLVFIRLGTLRTGRFPRIFDKSNPYTIQNIKLWCKLNNKPFELMSDKYDGNNKNLIWRCLKENCEEEFEMRWGDISQGQNCPYCAGYQVGLSNCLATKRPDLFLEWDYNKNGNLTPYDVTCGCHKYVWWICDKGHEWEAEIVNRINNRNCPYCAHKLPSEDYNLLICNPKLCEEWDYNKNDKNPDEYCPMGSQRVYWKCKECGWEWEARIADRSQNRGCPQCCKSKGEKKIKQKLDNENFIGITQIEYDKLNDFDKKINRYYISHKVFHNLLGLKNGQLSYDFYLPQYNLLIEYQGEQHDKPVDFEGKGTEYAEKQFIIQQEHDKRKRKYAQNNNINLLEIWYWDFDNISSILSKELKL